VKVERGWHPKVPAHASFRACRGELEFVRRLLTSSTSVGEYKAAAHAAARVAEAALKAVPQVGHAAELLSIASPGAEECILTCRFTFFLAELKSQHSRSRRSWPRPGVC
jgi:hypothetical protein